MLAGCAIGLISAAFAGLLIVTVAGDSPEAKLKRSFLAMMARLAGVVVLGAAAVLSGMFAISPLLFLGPDTSMAGTIVRQSDGRPRIPQAFHVPLKRVSNRSKDAGHLD